MNVKLKQSSNFGKASAFLNTLTEIQDNIILNNYGKQGVEALRLATPKDTGLTSESWNYKIESSNGSHKIVWTNRNYSDGACIALLIQYGHASQNGSWIEGRDYINPALKPIFEKLSKDALSEVVKAHEHNH